MRAPEIISATVHRMISQQLSATELLDLVTTFNNNHTDERAKFFWLWRALWLAQVH